MAQSSVTVAIVGPTFGYPEFPVFSGPGFEDQGWGVRYADRLKAEVLVAPETLLEDVMNNAAESFGIGSLDQSISVGTQMAHVGFFQDGEENGLPADYCKAWPTTLRITRSDGTPSWSCPWQQVRMDELEAASAAGLFEGDPHRLYLRPVIPQGDLASLADSLWTVWNYWDEALTIYGTYEIAKRIRARIKAGREAFEGDYAGMHEALARPQDVLPFLLSEARTTRQVAARVGMNEEWTAGMLQGMGFVCAPDGRWQWQKSDKAADALAQTVRMIEQHGGAPGEDEIRALIPDVCDVAQG